MLIMRKPEQVSTVQHALDTTHFTCNGRKKGANVVILPKTVIFLNWKAQLSQSIYSIDFWISLKNQPLSIMEYKEMTVVLQRKCEAEWTHLVKQVLTSQNVQRTFTKQATHNKPQKALHQLCMSCICMSLSLSISCFELNTKSCWIPN